MKEITIVRTASNIRSRIVVLVGLMLYLAMVSACTGRQAIAPAITPNPTGIYHTEPLGWPRLYQSGGDRMLMYQPQVQSWEDHSHMVMMAAVKVTPKGKNKKDIYGAVFVEASSQTNLDKRLVAFQNIRISKMTFPNVDSTTAERCQKIVRNTLKVNKQIQISLDRVIAAMERSKNQQRTVSVNMEPPPIYHSERPAILVIFIGEPKFESIKKTDLLYAVNTNWDVFLDIHTATYYLLNDKHWLTTKDVTKGPWVRTKMLPSDLYELPKDKNWENVSKNVPGKPVKTVPMVFASQTPAELIVTNGAPSLSPISGTPILYVTNTNSDLFLHSAEGNWYFLTAGRWFRAKQLDGPWSAASADLPQAFANIPINHPKSHVLTSVPGSPEAEAAVLLASIPQKATVNRSTATVTVVYEGKPQFVVIDGTSVYYAINSPYNVFQVAGAYYVCHNGVWFCSSSPSGSWKVCTKVPQAIYTIPSTHPKYNVTYVYVYESTPDTVTVGYTSGYTGTYVATTGLIMFGLGYAIGHGHDHYHHYHYHSHYYAYGSAARYDYYHGGFYRSAQAYGPYGGAGRSASYNPATGTYSRSAYRYGPQGGAFAREAYNPHTGRSGAQVGAKTPYGSWGRSVVEDGDNWARSGHRSNQRGTVAAAETSKGAKVAGGYNKRTGNSGFAGKSKYGDVYAGRNGNVYKRSDSGSWQKRSGNSWKSVQKPQPQLKHDYSSRKTGQYRSNQYQQRARSSRSAGRARRR